MKKNKIIVIDILIIACIIFIIFAGVRFLNDRSYTMISAAAAVLSCIPFYLSYDMKNKGVMDIVLVSVMVSVIVAGRFVFAVTPFFKPVTALVIITGFYLGKESGFVTGSVSALISNMMFGQGPWTPFQMLVWGMTGFIAGFFADRKITDSKVFLVFYSALAGMLFSMSMDVWTVISIDGKFDIYRYKAAFITSVPVMMIYIFSDIVFMFALKKSMGKRFLRIKNKYGSF